MDGALDDGALCGGAVEAGMDGELCPVYLLEEADGECAGADGGVADAEVVEQGAEAGGVLGEPAFLVAGVDGLLGADEPFDGGAGVGIAGEMAGERVDEALLAHVLDDGLGGVVGAFVFVVLQKVLENVAEHLGVDADLVVLRVVFVDREVVFAEEGEELVEEVWREVDALDAGEIALEEAAVQVRHAGAGDGEEVARAGRVEGIEEKRDEACGVEAFFFRRRRGVEEIAEEGDVAAGPIGAGGIATEPAFLLQEVEEDEATEEFFDEVADGLEGAVAVFAVLPFEVDAEDGCRGVAFQQVQAEGGVVLLVAVEEFLADRLDIECGDNVLQRGLRAFYPENGEAVARSAARLAGAEDVGEAAGGRLFGNEVLGGGVKP